MVLAIREYIDARFQKKVCPLKIVDYLDPKLILFLQAKTRDEAIKQLVEVLAKEKKVPDKHIFYKALLDREKIASTGVGMAVAIPHAKLGFLSHFFMAIGVQTAEGLSWQSIDKAPVKLIFLIGGPDNRQTEYLQILSSLTQVIKNEGFRKKLFRAKTPEEVFSLFETLDLSQKNFS